MSSLVSNKHTALFYESEEEYLDIVIPFLKSGLENNEFVLWALPEFMKAEDANGYLLKSFENPVYSINNEQILIQDYKTTYIKEGTFFSRGMIDSWEELENKVLEKGFNGICAVGDGSWALEAYWMNFLMYESEINSIIEDHKMRAICTYYKKNMELRIICDIGKNHQETFVKQNGDWNRLSPGDFQW
ncbi:MAG: hypothetical protein A2Y03_07025 [Omnitrophica WOR_2 bacterium GWF2_38_59]|nr:MAG: hypothetical protein A2Y03_07025 [Omnitrophica WOR_2 bacterium GWF2_38_59]OGX47419.1 MAG: hypothetical protein A2243_01670 [Omnitrophica WOR_2 bacterium RIFOXYA2_FULL_38_17]OGX57686.1 MAG: hypothetical protein A2306_07725 [Omnitrophica WOR_2 bacterium RIFOXYB2_FULL_38_16]OGX59215.1 MAG: hypothetical protein A2447_01715 [Omnitrophica WOR_2 bacterium RIFOXYC2_FULL_38_12]HBG61975.1 hypothetical protein [Candidatus Omnitrophota bacterium]